MADGYARISGRIAVIAGQNGPAAALLVAPQAEALKASVPVVALVQEIETSAHGRNAFQEFDHEALFRGCTKWLRHAISGARVEDHVDATFVAAGSGRPGPAVLLLPKDVQTAAVELAAARSQSFGRWPIDRPRPDERSLEAAAAMLGTARAPVVVAGGGTVSAAAASALALDRETPAGVDQTVVA
jgi:acetolactate synthase I/II/III large subunit